MSYLERNITLINEVSENVHLARGAKIGDGQGMRFNSAGKYVSPEIDKTVFVGVKQPHEVGGYFYEASRVNFDLEFRFMRELAIMNVIAENMPTYLPELPLFYGLLTGQGGNLLGIVTEDFSLNGRYKIYPHTSLPEDLRETLREQYGVRLDSAVTAFAVNGKRRLGDFDTASISGELLDFAETYINLDEHTLRIDYSY